MNQVTAAFFASVVTLLIGAGGVWASRRKDKDMANVAVVVGRSDEVQAVINGWKNLARSLQADAQALRDEASRDEARWAAAEERARTRAAECAEVENRLARMLRRYGDNGDILPNPSKGT